MGQERSMVNAAYEGDVDVFASRRSLVGLRDVSVVLIDLTRKRDSEAFEGAEGRAELGLLLTKRPSLCALFSGVGEEQLLAFYFEFANGLLAFIG